MERQNKITIGMIILGMIFIILIAVVDSPKDISIEEEFVECLSNNSILYVKEGCTYCQFQKDLFGDKLDSLNIIDCAIKPEICIENNIEAIPTWVFDEISLVGFQSLSQLENITGCYND